MVARLRLRWLVAVGIAAAALVAGVTTTAIHASADRNLPERRTADLVADVRSAPEASVSGTVIEHAELVPALPEGIGGTGSAQFDSLITGTHTLRIWTDGPTRERIALIGSLGESDSIRNGSNLWIWSSNDNTATHITPPTGPAGSTPSLPLWSVLPSAMTPAAIASEVIKEMPRSTSVTSGPSMTVAGRPAYQLVIAPSNRQSLIGSVHIAIDGAMHVPVQVQVYPRGAERPAFELGYTQISFADPDPAEFRFNPPPGVRLRTGGPDIDAADPGRLPRSAPSPSATMQPVAGSGWSTVVRGPVPFVDDGPGGQGDSVIDAATAVLPTVSGPWGTAKLLETSLFSALITTHGQLYIGAVNASQLEAAAKSAGR